jgi:hypothetical protein
VNGDPDSLFWQKVVAFRNGDTDRFLFQRKVVVVASRCRHKNAGNLGSYCGQWLLKLSAHASSSIHISTILWQADRCVL